MGTNTLATAVSGNTIPVEHNNGLKQALEGDIVPRNSSGVATANAGDCGTSTYPFKKANITSGYLFTGMIMPFHSYNGALSPGQGWMKCDARVVNQANYDAEHGAGSWASFIVASDLDGLNLPNLTGSKYLSGVSTTTQDGSVAITEVGNASNQVNLGHSHTVNSHNHQWYNNVGLTGDDQTYNSAGSAVTLPANGASKSSGVYNILASYDEQDWNVIEGSAISRENMGDSYTTNTAPGTNTQLSVTQSIQPRSVEVIYYMRIV